MGQYSKYLLFRYDTINFLCEPLLITHLMLLIFYCSLYASCFTKVITMQHCNSMYPSVLCTGVLKQITIGKHSIPHLPNYLLFPVLFFNFYRSHFLSSIISYQPKWHPLTCLPCVSADPIFSQFSCISLVFISSLLIKGIFSGWELTVLFCFFPLEL